MLKAALCANLFCATNFFRILISSFGTSLEGINFSAHILYRHLALFNYDIFFIRFYTLIKIQLLCLYTNKLNIQIIDTVSLYNPYTLMRIYRTYIV